VALETIQGRAIFNGSRNGIPFCRRAVAEGAPTKICSQIVMAGVVGGDCRDKMADRL